MLPSSDLAIVLRSKPFKERDRLVTLLTENHGRLSGIAKGAIHSRRFGGSLDLFMCSDIEFVEKPEQDLVSIRGATNRRDFAYLREDLEKISAAGYFVDLVLRLTEEKLPIRPVFLLLAHYLYLLESTPMTMNIVRSFEIKLLDRLGITPTLDKCAVTGDEGFWHGQGLVAFSMEHGGVIRDEHASSVCRKVRRETVTWLRSALNAAIQEIPKQQASTVAMLEGAEILQGFLRYHGPGLQNYEFRSHQLLESMLKNEPVPGQASAK